MSKIDRITSGNPNLLSLIKRIEGRQGDPAGKTEAPERAGRSMSRSATDATTRLASLATRPQVTASSLPRPPLGHDVLARALAHDVAPLLNNRYPNLEAIMSSKVLTAISSFNAIASSVH